jgi:hypothetical protein
MTGISGDRTENIARLLNKKGYGWKMRLYSARFWRRKTQFFAIVSI